MAVIDSYSETNRNTDEDLMGTFQSGYGQSITGNGSTIGSAQFYLRKSTSPTGNAVAKIYAISGIHGTNAVPSGSALATSDNVDVSTIPTASNTLITFTFSGVNQITLTNTTNYIITIEYTGGNGSNFIDVGVDASSPTHAGNASFFDTSWHSTSSYDICFYVNDTAGATTTSSSTTTTSTSTSSTTTSTSSTTLPFDFIGMKISKPGIDVLKTNMPNDLIFSSQYNTLKYDIEGSLTVSSGTVAASTMVVKTVSYNHNLGYFPFHDSYVATSLIGPFQPYGYANLATVNVYITTYVTKTTLVLVLTVENNDPVNSYAGTDAYCYFKIFKNNLNL